MLPRFPPEADSDRYDVHRGATRMRVNRPRRETLHATHVSAAIRAPQNRPQRDETRVKFARDRFFASLQKNIKFSGSPSISTNSIFSPNFWERELILHKCDSDIFVRIAQISPLKIARVNPRGRSLCFLSNVRNFKSRNLENNDSPLPHVPSRVTLQQKLRRGVKISMSSFDFGRLFAK